jgi:peptidoglycan/LPS O-acetylase OafA/YrhL
LRCLPEFALGLLAYRLAATPFGLGVGSSRWIAPLVCLITFAALALPGTDLVVVTLFPLLLICLASGPHLPGRILASPPAQFAGTISYSIYLTHDLLTGLLNWIHQRVHSAGLAHAQTYAAATGIALTLPIAWLAYRIIEAPGRRWLRGRFEDERIESAAAPFSARATGEAAGLAAAGSALSGTQIASIRADNRA